MIIGQNPLPQNVQEKVWDLVEWLDKNHEIKNGSTSFYWALSYYIANELGDKQNGKY